MQIRWVLVVWVISWVGSLGCYEDTAREDLPSLPPYDASLCVQEDQIPRLVSLQEVAVTGVTNNALRIRDGFGWVVHSGDNTVGRFDLDTGTLAKDFIDVGEGRNPWDLDVMGGRVYITNFLSGTVSVADAATGRVLGETPAGMLKGPSGLKAAGDWVVVADSGFVGPAYEEGAFVVFRVLETAPFLERVASLPASALNPADVVWDAQRDLFYGTSSGALGFGETGFVAETDGSIDAFSVRDGAQVEVVRAQSVSIERRAQGSGLSRGGAPRSLVVEAGGRFGYLPSMVSGELYKVDLSTFEVISDPNRPIQVYLGEGDQLTDVVLGAGPFGYVLSYNQDAVYILDTTCDASVAGPFSVGGSTQIEGALRAAWDPTRSQLWVIATISSALWKARVDLE